MQMLLVDDHPLVLEGMRAVTCELGDDVELLTATNLAGALQVLAECTNLELMLLDLGLPDGDGFVALRACRERYPAVPVVVMSASQQVGDMRRALRDGAAGFIPKSLPPAVVINALRLVLAGGTYIPTEMVGGLPGVDIDARGASADTPPARDGRLSNLTQRQREVLEFIARGRSNKSIGLALGCSEATVKAHVTAVLKVIGVANRTQAAAWAATVDIANGGERGG